MYVYEYRGRRECGDGGRARMNVKMSLGRRSGGRSPNDICVRACVGEDGRSTDDR